MKTVFDDLKKECTVLLEQLPIEAHELLEETIARREAELKHCSLEYLLGYANAMARAAGQAEAWLRMPEFNVPLIKEHVITKKFLALKLIIFIFEALEVSIH